MPVTRFVVVLLLLTSTGCVNFYGTITYRFQVVDAETGLPLQATVSPKALTMLRPVLIPPPSESIGDKNGNTRLDGTFELKARWPNIEVTVAPPTQANPQQSSVSTTFHQSARVSIHRHGKPLFIVVSPVQLDHSFPVGALYEKFYRLNDPELIPIPLFAKPSASAPRP